MPVGHKLSHAKVSFKNLVFSICLLKALSTEELMVNLLMLLQAHGIKDAATLVKTAQANAIE